MAGLTGDGVGQAVAVGVGARRGGVAGRVLGRGQRHAGTGRRVVGGADRQVDRDRVRVGRPVVGLVGEAVGTDVIGRRGIAQRAGRRQGQRTVDRITDLDRDQAVAIGVGVVAEDAWGGHDPGRVLGRAVAVGHRHRRVVGGTDRDGHGRTGRIDGPVVGRIAEAVWPVVVGGRHVVQLAGHDRGRAVAGLTGDGVGQAVAVGVGARRGGVAGRVLGRGQRHAGTGRRVVGGADRDGHGRIGRIDRPVVGRVAEAVGPVVVGGRHVVQLAGHDRGRAVAGLTGDGVGQAVAVGVGARRGGVAGRVLGRGQRHAGTGRRRVGGRTTGQRRDLGRGQGRGIHPGVIEQACVEAAGVTLGAEAERQAVGGDGGRTGHRALEQAVDVDPDGRPVDRSPRHASRPSCSADTTKWS